ncbi:MAG: hypothetical protein Q8Q01_02735 [archaeon]|nr:hypothetical protein [archaeon]
MAPAHFGWSFPRNKLLFMRIEAVAVSIVAVLIFFVAIAQTDLLIALSSTLGFILLYTIVSFIILNIRRPHEEYHVKSGNLHIIRKTRFSQKSAKIPLKGVKRHKFDKLFLGGYVLAGKKRHSLFFNTISELKKFEKEIKKHMKG